MKVYEVILGRLALQHLKEIEDYLSAQAVTFVTENYTNRIKAACASLSQFPHRGRSRGDLGAGIRAIGFEGRATIVFRIYEDRVRILGIFFGGRDYEALLRGHMDE